MVNLIWDTLRCELVFNHTNLCLIIDLDDGTVIASTTLLLIYDALVLGWRRFHVLLSLATITTVIERLI